MFHGLHVESGAEKKSHTTGVDSPQLEYRDRRMLEIHNPKPPLQDACGQI